MFAMTGDQLAVHIVRQPTVIGRRLDCLKDGQLRLSRHAAPPCAPYLREPLLPGFHRPAAGTLFLVLSNRQPKPPRVDAALNIILISAGVGSLLALPSHDGNGYFF
jgi:hypothetical protein